MKRDEFKAELLNTGHYQTPDKTKIRFLDRLFGWSDTWYYARFFELVMRGSTIAKFGKYGKEEWITNSLRTWSLVEGCRGILSVEGLEHIAEVAGPKVYVGNHMSMLETFLLPGLVANYDFTTIVVKESLLTYPVFGPIMRAAKPISVTRRNPRQDLKDVMSKGKEALESGRSVLIFPQSTRTPEFDPATFNSLGSKLADRSGVPVIPFAVKTDYMSIGKKFKDFGKIDRSKKVHIKFGEAINVDGNVRDTQKALVDFISSNLREWGGTVKEADASDVAK